MTRNWRWWSVLGLVVVAWWAWAAARPAPASELEKLGTSLNIVPDDASFYSTMLRNREQIEAIANSRAWAKLKSMPVVQMALQMYRAKADDSTSVPGQIEFALQNPEVRKLLALAGDMFSDEVFCYGDATFADFVELAQEMVGAMRYGPAALQLSGKAEGLNENQLQARVLLAALAKNADRIKVPDMVVGFKLSKPEAAREQLAQLEQAATALLEGHPQLKGRLKRSKIGDHEYLVLSLDGSLVPWDQLPLDQLKQAEAEPGQADKVIDRLKKMTLVVALGVRDRYLLAAIGSTTDCVARLGGPKRLVDRPEMKPLEKFADRRLTDISYLSKPLAERLANNQKQIDDLLKFLNTALPKAELTADQQARIRKDAAALAADLKRLMPQSGAVMGFSFLVPQGIEQYQYNWSENARVDASKPLSLLRHLGGNPILAAVGRNKITVSDYDLFVKWCKVGYGYFEELALPKMPPHEREQFDKFAKLAAPLLQRIDKAEREMLIPAQADGEIGIVLDAKLRSKHFIAALPATDKAMPMIEPALVLGISDAGLFLKGCDELRTAINGLIDALSQIEGTEIPQGMEIPEAKATKVAAGTIYGLPLREDWGVDKKIEPNLGVSDTVAVFSISPKQTERLLKSAALKTGGLLAKTDRPLAAAMLLDWAGLIDAATPWVDLAVEQIVEKKGEGAEAAGIRDQVHTVLTVLKVLRTVTSEGYVEDGAVVTHTLMEIRDVAE
jgi:hypothetical protein